MSATPLQLSLFGAGKRWRDRRERWVRPETVFNPAGYSVDVIHPQKLARPFVERHHYERSFCAARLCLGLFGPGPRLVGVVVYGVPMSQEVLRRWLGTTDAACELSRLVLLDEVAYNAETWTIARSERLLLRERGVESIVSFADPLERRSAAGELVKRQHWGAVYVARGMTLAGRTRPQPILIAPDGTTISRRTLQKIRKQERGHEYATRILLSHGAEPRRRGESWPDWLTRVSSKPPFRRLPHPGNLSYVRGLTPRARDRLAALHGDGIPHPLHAARERAA